ncbi:MAG TPA: hypothetical protein VKP30_28195, partial [Polyangiaceae bacterium]|nr:hypothetical protein [Polyangiaceae bacterium]
HEARKKQIHLALTAPRSEPPPPIPEGIEAIVASGTGMSVHSLVLERNRQMMWTIAIAVGAALLALGGMIAFLAWRGSRIEQVTAPPSVATTPPTQIQIRLAASPPAAALFLDGNPLSSNPATLTVPTDARDHEIKATLAGHEPYDKVVRFERDLSLEIMLQPLPAPAAATTAPTTTKPPRQVVGPVRPFRPAPVASAPGKKVPANCDPPFYFEAGIKVFKPGCL